MPKFNEGDLSPGGDGSGFGIAGAVFSGLSFLSGIGSKTRQMRAQAKSAKIGMEGIKSEMDRSRLNLMKDKDTLLGKYNLGIQELVAGLGNTAEEFQNQLEGVFKQTRGLSSSETTGLKENTLESLNESIEAQQEKLEFDFDTTYDSVLRDFDEKNRSKQLQLKDLMAKYNYAKKHDKWYNNII